MDYSTLLFIDCKTAIWEKSSHQPAGQTNEIIGIDIAMVDTNANQIIEQEQVFVKPKKSKIGQYCERIFGIKQSQIDTDGVSFQEIYRKLRVHYMIRDRLWASWGTYDRFSLDKQCKMLNLESLLCQTHLNMQHLSSVMLGLSTDDPLLNLQPVLDKCGLSPNKNKAFSVAQVYLRMAKGLRPVFKPRIVVPTNHSTGYN